MPSKNRQLNMRVSDSTWTIIDLVRPVVARDLGFESLSYTDLLRLAVIALGKSHNVKGMPDKHEPTKRGRKPKGE